MRYQRILSFVAIAATLLAGGWALPATAQTLKQVKERGQLACGVSQGIAGFSSMDEKGQWSGFDVDFCRALAAAVFGDGSKVRFVPLSAAERFQALKSGQVDVLSRNSTWTLTRESEFGIVFAGVTYYDGQGFMVPKARAVTSALELDGAKICVQMGTTTKDNVVDFFAANNLQREIIEVASPADARKAYEEGLCTVLSSDVSQLHAERLSLAKPGEHMILPDVISKEPLGPAVRQDDMQWLAIVKWVNFAMLNAEELGVNSKTVDDALRSAKPSVRRLVGNDGRLGERLGLANDWVVAILRTTGNYGEVFDRNVGTNSRLAMPRGINQLWSLGGIQYAPPLN